MSRFQTQDILKQTDEEDGEFVDIPPGAEYDDDEVDDEREENGK
jgi:hypothetical protein